MAQKWSKIAAQGEGRDCGPLPLWHGTDDMWHATCDMWNLTVFFVFCLNGRGRCLYLLYQCLYLHTSRDSESPICGLIKKKKFRRFMSFIYQKSKQNIFRGGAGCQGKKNAASLIQKKSFYNCKTTWLFKAFYFFIFLFI